MYTEFSIVLPSQLDEIWVGILESVDTRGLYLGSFQKQDDFLEDLFILILVSLSKTLCTCPAMMRKRIQMSKKVSKFI